MLRDSIFSPTRTALTIKSPGVLNWAEQYDVAGVIGSQQLRRMKHIELISELLHAAHQEDVANKKRVLQVTMQQDGR